ncbi:hypothetical protein JOF28_001314 [Leucobacter exalbidus]|uniref:LGFP repeat-containing protein n=1 Tax=Leucobacter exalbidus TaxID=662960 RepID=A0A940PSP4_9MICO|nr:hypothetical protein [Leucobacter exalbidus]MBP1326082.1 hypothetical protein [Leucobacter exalbidus]
MSTPALLQSQPAPRDWARRVLRAGVILVSAVAIALSGVALAPATAAEAAPVKGFEPGNIIADAVFYNGTDLGASQVQTFLNNRVARCTIGDPGKPSGGTYTFPSGTKVKLGKNCLKDSKFSTKTYAADSYCKKYTGKSNESAAAIIAKVGAACGINPKVLLVMLEKEQSLITDTFPAQHQFDRAMGYACPDSGPNNSANCNTAYYGFQQQVYYGARQYKVYLANPWMYRYRAQATNTIQWHPNPACGTSRVFIQNNATAALYIYTPYRPNDAALKAGWGTGDSCSTYGNRNFYQFFTTWFGSPHKVPAPTPSHAYPVRGVIEAFYTSSGGSQAFGVSTTKKASHTRNGGGVSQMFTKGMIAYSKKYQQAVFVPKGSTLTRYLKLNGPAGEWGWPQSTSAKADAAGVVTTLFQRGLANAHPTLGVKFMPNKILRIWEKQGGSRGSLGYPSGNGVTIASDTLYQRFENGGIMYSPEAKISVSRPEELRWRRAGGPSLGLLVDRQSVVRGVGTYQQTQKGTLYTLTGQPSVFLRKGQALSAYVAAGGPESQGWPRSPLSCGLSGGGCKLSLQRNTMIHSPQTGASFLTPGHHSAWNALGSARYTTLGYPMQSTKRLSAGTLQRYQYGFTSFPTNAKKAALVTEKLIVDAYIASGWHKSTWGLPLKVSTSGRTVTFEHGTARVSGGKFTFTPAGKLPAASTREAAEPIPEQVEEEAPPADQAPEPAPEPEVTPEPVPEPELPTEPEPGLPPQPETEDPEEPGADPEETPPPADGGAPSVEPVDPAPSDEPEQPPASPTELEG